MNNLVKILAEVPKPKPLEGASTDLEGDVKSIVNTIVGVLGLVAVITLIIGGVYYMTSAGDSAKVKKAKDTILYAIIGLVVVMLSYAIVNWVIEL